MGLFSFFRKHQRELTGQAGNAPVDVSRDLFIDDTDPAEKAVSGEWKDEPAGIGAVYRFLQGDYESKGYQDALTNPDESYKNDNLKLFRQDLFILLQKAGTYYETLLRRLDFHIGTRERAGLVDLVEELRSQKELVSSYLDKIRDIHTDAKNNSGMTERITLSYQRGFNRGLAAISKSEILDKNL